MSHKLKFKVKKLILNPATNQSLQLDGHQSCLITTSALFNRPVEDPLYWSEISFSIHNSSFIHFSCRYLKTNVGELSIGGGHFGHYGHNGHFIHFRRLYRQMTMLTHFVTSGVLTITINIMRIIAAYCCYVTSQLL